MSGGEALADADAGAGSADADADGAADDDTDARRHPTHKLNTAGASAQERGRRANRARS